VCNGYLSAQSVYINQYFCLTCIYQLFLILDHNKSYVEKNTKNQWCPWAPGRPQGPTRLSAGIGAAKRHGHQISSIPCRCALWEVLSQTILLLAESQNIGSKKVSGWLHYCPRACSKNNISMISVFTLRNILIVNTKIKVNWATFLFQKRASNW